MSDFHFVRREQIQEGWSEDRKYCAMDKDGTRYLLRISPIEQYERKQAEFRMMEQTAALGIPMCLPLEFGVCDEGVYSVQSWIDGVGAEEAIPKLSDTEQYVYGLEAGRILRKIHSLPVLGKDAGTAEEAQPGAGEDCSSRTASPECDGKFARESGADEDSRPVCADGEGKSAESGADEDSRPARADSDEKSAQESGVDEGSRRPADAGGEGKYAQESTVGKKENRADVFGGKAWEDWETRFGRKMDRKIKKYRECPLQYQGGEHFIRYIEENRHLLKDRPQGYQHGDYHIGNMMLDKERRLQVIDFNRFDYGDPWEEFNRIVWCVQASPLFASGMVNGYFDGQVPEAFWRLLALYIASNTLSSLYWAIPFGQEEVDTMQKQAAEVLSWYDNMGRVIPSWYFEGYYLQYIDGIPYKLKEPFDFSFLNRYGRVFRVFDDQDSGNICFGTQKGEERFFVKFAGAPTQRGSVAPAEAVERLKAAGVLYRELRHENLIPLAEARETGGGYALVFQWAEGDCMGRMYPEAHRRFMALPLERRMEVFRNILSFLEEVVSRQYVAIDFYDGSILYDFERGRTFICDIDFFRRQPCINDMGRMWGSSLFQSPEEYRLGAKLDEVTNVYTAGAFAFALFGGYERTRDRWQLDDSLFAVAQKAVEADRNRRHQSIRQFRKAWEEACSGFVSLL